MSLDVLQNLLLDFDPPGSGFDLKDRLLDVWERQNRPVVVQWLHLTHTGRSAAQPQIRQAFFACGAILLVRFIKENKFCWLN